MTLIPGDSVVEIARPRRGLRRIAVAGLAAVFAACFATVVICLLLSSPSGSMLVGAITGSQIGYVAVMVGLVAVVAFVFVLPTQPRWLFLKVPFAIVSGLVLVAMTVGLMFVADTKVTPILVDGCASGYIAVEPSGGAGSYVGVRTGLRIVKVQTFSGDDFDRPFSAGDYSATQHGQLIDVAHAGDADDPAFSLPLLDNRPCS